MCREYKLVCFNWCCQLLPCFEGELNLVRWWKNVYHVSTKQHGGLKSSVSRARNSTILQSVRADALSCWKLQRAAKVKLFHKYVKAIVLGDFCGRTNKTLANCHQGTRWSSLSKQGSYIATDKTSKLVLTTHYDGNIAPQLAKNI